MPYVYMGMAAAARPGTGVEQEDERQLLEQARRGDREAAAWLLQQHELAIFRTCRHLLPAGEDVEAAVQEVFLRALRALGRFAGECSFGGWLTSIAINLCRDRLRRRRLIPFLPLEVEDEDAVSPLAVLPSPEPDPERVAMAREAVRRLRRELHRLSARQHEVFALRFFVGLELERIAEALAVDVGTVKTHLHRALQRVRVAVEEARP